MRTVSAGPRATACNGMPPSQADTLQVRTAVGTSYPLFPATRPSWRLTTTVLSDACAPFVYAQSHTPPPRGHCRQGNAAASATAQPLAAWRAAVPRTEQPTYSAQTIDCGGAQCGARLQHCTACGSFQQVRCSSTLGRCALPMQMCTFHDWCIHRVISARCF